jgi:beta-glucosidase/6-phospho-beta-glucosidase/beta-galactosidase
MGLLSRAWPPGRRNPVRLSRSLDHVGRAAIEASSTIRSVNADARIGHSIGAPDVLPFDDESPWDYRAAKWLNAFESAGTYVDPESMYRLGDAIEDSASDEPFHFWVMPLPGRRWLRFSPTAIREGFIRPVSADGDPANYLQREVDAGQIEPVLREMQLEDKPVLFVGGAHDFADDRARCAYILDHIEAILHCKDNGLDVMGYVHESYLDGFEWDRGYSTRRGLLHVDWETLARTPNQSAYLLGDIARQGGITPGAIRKHCPGWESKLEAVR